MPYLLDLLLFLGRPLHAAPCQVLVALMRACCFALQWYTLGTLGCTLHHRCLKHVAIGGMGRHRRCGVWLHCGSCPGRCRGTRHAPPARSSGAQQRSQSHGQRLSAVCENAAGRLCRELRSGQGASLCWLPPAVRGGCCVGDAGRGRCGHCCGAAGFSAGRDGAGGRSCSCTTWAGRRYNGGHPKRHAAHVTQGLVRGLA